MYLYIMGGGHSGSTILDILLGNSSQIESVGELLSGLGQADHGRCSCGATMSACPFWRAVRARLETQDISWDEARRARERGAAGLWRVWRAGTGDPAMERRAQIMLALAQAITTVAGKPHLLDSSKAVAHGLLLLRHVPEAQVIHLVRDPRQVLRSFVWRVRSHQEHIRSRWRRLAARNAPLFLAWMAANWTLRNLSCELIARAFPDRVLRVRFEDLCAQPARELDRIGRALGLDLADLGRKAAAEEPLVVGHNVGGNHLRHAQTVRFDPGGGRARPPLPRWLGAVTILLCGPLMWRYGYWPGRGDPRPVRSRAVPSG